MKIQDIMTADPACCAPETNLREVARLMVDHDCGEIPVTRDGKPIGVVTDRDIAARAVAVGRNPLELTARDCMSSPVITVTPSTDVKDCCDTMEQHQIRRVPVVDSNGVCCGMVSQADIAKHASARKTAEVVKQVSQPANGDAARP
jgi:CBS domain-containing protein